MMDENEETGEIEIDWDYIDDVTDRILEDYWRQ